MLERSIFMKALDCQTAAERSALLDEACAHDPALRQRVEALLHSHASAGSFLGQPVPERLAEKLEIPPGPEETQPPQSDEGDEQTLEFLAPSDSPGSLGKLGHYEVREVIGRGGMGIVLQAFDERLHRVVAIKVMAAQLATSATARKRFIREARAAAAISHDHIVTIHAVEEANGLPYIAMQYVAGQSLQQKINLAGHLELKEILRIGQQIAAGLAAAHTHGLMHRDVKPANILLENGVERVRITDFGLARAVDDVSMTRTGEVAGTPQYMSPEQAQGLPMDARSDLFSLGCVLYAMCTGRSPFRAETTFATVRRVCEDKPRAIRDVNPEIPSWFVEIIDRLLAKQPADRIQSAAEVAELLGRRLAEVQHPSTVGQSPAAGVKSALRTSRSHPLLWSAAAVLLCAVLLLGLSEAGGVTKLTTSVIRVLTPQGTLIIEVDDPDVKVTVEGDGGLVITGAGPREVRLPTGKYKVRATKDGQPVKEEVVSISRGGKQTVSVSREPFTAAPIARGVGKTLAPRAILKGHTKWVESFAFSPDGQTVATSSGDHHVRFWNLATGDQTGQFLADHHNIAWSAYSPDGTLLVTGSLSTNVRVWNALTHERLAEVKHDDWVWAVAFRRRDSLLATCSRDKTVRLWKWDGSALAPVRTLEPHSGGVTAIAYSPSGDTIAAATNDGMLHLWDVESGQQLKSSRIGRYELRALAFSPDGKTIAVGGYGKHVELRSSDTLASVGTLQGHQEWVWSVAFLPDSKSLVSAGGHFDFQTITSNRPGELKVWDIASGQERLSLDGHAKGVRCVALSPDGKTLATGDFAGLGRLWDVDALLAAAELANQPASKTSRASDSAQIESKAFVLLGGQGVAERKFDTLAEAVLTATDGDAIEIRGNGPFLTAPIVIPQSLTIRAGEGFLPVIRLNPGAGTDDYLIEAHGSLVLEGLEIREASKKRTQPALVGRCVIASRGDSIHVANCRIFQEAPIYEEVSLIFAETDQPVDRKGHANIALRNCQFRTRNGQVAGFGNEGPARFVMDNSLCLGGHVTYLNRSHPSNEVKQEFRRNTIVTNLFAMMGFSVAPDPPRSDGKEKPVRFDASENVIDLKWGMIEFQPLEPFAAQANWRQAGDAEAFLMPLLSWRESRNLFSARATAIHWSPRPQDGRLLAPANLQDWQRRWGITESESLEGSPRFHGGDLLARAAIAPEKITPEDFRLRPDSAGYRAGPDGKDLGADVDLVGPGPAYERWKETPEYQQWLKETGQASDSEASKTERNTFVVLTSKGAEVSKFDALPAAVAGASDGDIIEIRGNGPFISDPVNILDRALTIRAGAGFRPVIKLNSEAAQRDVPLLATSAALVLEGLDLHRTPPDDPAYGRYAFIKTFHAPLRAANCRFSAGIYPIGSPVCVFRNCEFLAAGHVSGQPRSGAQLVFENCLRHPKTFPLLLTYDDVALLDISIEIKRNTILSDYALFRLGLKCPLPALSDSPPAPGSFRFGVSGSIFDAPAVLAFDQSPEFLEKTPMLSPDDAKGALLRLLKWQGQRNLYVTRSPSVRWIADRKQQPPRGPNNLEEWKQFWGTAEIDSLESGLRFQGGDLHSRSVAASAELTPTDFRLREGSPGYRALPDGKDLGADVDLVGPGPAYERWQKTPEYAQWLVETRQVKE